MSWVNTMLIKLHINNHQNENLGKDFGRECHIICFFIILMSCFDKIKELYNKGIIQFETIWDHISKTHPLTLNPKYKLVNPKGIFNVILNFWNIVIYLDYFVSFVWIWFFFELFCQLFFNIWNEIYIYIYIHFWIHLSIRKYEMNPSFKRTSKENLIILLFFLLYFAYTLSMMYLFFVKESSYISFCYFMLILIIFVYLSFLKRNL